MLLHSISRSFAAALVLFSIGSVSVLATPAEDAYRQGKYLLDKKDHRAAIEALDKAINLDPTFGLYY